MRHGAERNPVSAAQRWMMPHLSRNHPAPATQAALAKGADPLGKFGYRVTDNRTTC